MKKYWKTLQEFVDNHQFLVMIVGVLVIAIVATAFNIWLYIFSGAINVDLSRPGYEAVRNETAEEFKVQTFSADGSLNQQVREDFLMQLDALQNDLRQMNNFDDDSLSDKALNLE